MVQEKKSLQDTEKTKITKLALGSEFGAVIENDPESYPPTGQWRDQIPMVDKTKCIGCEACAKHCPENSIIMKKVSSKKKSVINYQFCKGCGVCSEVCPVKAITMKKT